MIRFEENDVFFEVALQYNSGYNENIYSFVNNINTHDGGLVLFPTETVYGIGANGLNDEAVKNISMISRSQFLKRK